MTDLTKSRLIAEPQQLLKVAQLLIERNEALLYWNVNEDIRFILRGGERTDYEEACEKTVVELCIFAGSEGILSEDDTEDEENVEALRQKLRTILDLDCAGYWCTESADHWVIGRYVFSSKKITEELDNAAQQINDAFCWKVCGCEKRLVKSANDSMCLFCELTSTVEQRVDVFCGICADKCPKQHAHFTSCCHQEIHTACLSKWIRTSATVEETEDDIVEQSKVYTCPFCRKKQKVLS